MCATQKVRVCSMWCVECRVSDQKPKLLNSEKMEIGEASQ